MKSIGLTKTISILFIGLALGTSATAQTVTMPRDVSQAAEVRQTVGLTNITVNYSRPDVTNKQGNDRTGKIWGQLVPYGFNVDPFGFKNPSPWRAGANENTTITFTDDVKIEGKPLKAGTYGFHVAVFENNTATIIFSNNSTSWGSFYYVEKEDALRVNIKTTEIPFTKILTYSFIDLEPSSTTLALDWEYKRFPFKIDVDVKAVVLNNIRNELRSTASFTWQGYMSAAQYCVANKVNQEEAIKWIDKSITMNRNVQNLTVKSQLLNQSGDKAGCNKVIDEAAGIADINQLNAMGYQLIGIGNVDKAIEMFQLNVKRNPKDANVYDSLGEAYRIKGDQDLAIKNFKKSLSLDPPDNVKSNSLKNLKEMGVVL